MKASIGKGFKRNYALLLQHLKLKGLEPKRIEAYSRPIRRIGERFESRIDALSEQQQGPPEAGSSNKRFRSCEATI